MLANIELLDERRLAIAIRAIRFCLSAARPIIAVVGKVEDGV